MALFNGRDTELPNLTQLYQLAPPPEGWEKDPSLLEGTELETWFRRQGGEETWQQPVLWAENIDTEKSIYPEEWFVRVKIKPQAWRKKWHRHLSLLAELYTINRRILDTKADHDAIRGKALFRLDTLISKYLPAGLGLVHNFSAGKMVVTMEYEPDDRLYTAEQIGESESMKRNMSRLSALILFELKKLVLADGTAGRCSECKSAFARTKSTKIYCSHRCAHRAGTRRRRKESVVTQK
ncbi:MAG: hypothetical protein V4671_11035 [Armatimonadota bacterium]